MSVAVSCNLSEGVILGVDSAVTLPAPQGIIKVYENAEKLFQLGDRPIGIAVFGLAALGDRSIGSYITEFELTHPRSTTGEDGLSQMAGVVEELRAFFWRIYRSTVIDEWKKLTGKSLRELSTVLPPLGLVVAGFSVGSYLPEVWSINLPANSTKGSAKCNRKKGDFGTNWFAMFEPIRRYIKGWDPEAIQAVLSYVEDLLGRSISPPEHKGILGILNEHEYQIPFAAMPMTEGLAHTRFLVELVVNHHRFSVGAPVVGGRVRLGRVSYKNTKFEILRERDFWELGLE